MSKHSIVVGLAYGDEGKGTIVEHQVRTRDAKLVVRFNGGAQAGHNVVLADGRHHTFAQFGCGTFAGAATLLSRHVLVNPSTLLAEARDLAGKGVPDPLRLMHIDREALVTTPFHVAANRLRELTRGDARHGSCGMGIGETVEDARLFPDHAIRIRDFEDATRLRRKLEALQGRKFGEMQQLEKQGRRPEKSEAWTRASGLLVSGDAVEAAIDAATRVRTLCTRVDETFLARHLAEGPVVFEGAQGALLDQDYGFHPHTTWSRTCAANAYDLLDDIQEWDVAIIGVTRAFMTRHGAGPFVTEDPRWLPYVEHDHNRTGPWQGAFRAGHLDLVALRYGAKVALVPDEVAVTHLDTLHAWSRRTSEDTIYCNRYHVDQDDQDPELFQLKSFCEASDLTFSALEPRASLTEALGRADPIYSATEDVVGTIAEALRAPVTITSWGHRFEDKRTHDGARLPYVSADVSSAE